MRQKIIGLVAPLALLAAPTGAQQFQFREVVNKDELFVLAQDAIADLREPSLSDGKVLLRMRTRDSSSYYIASTGGAPFVVLQDGDVMPDGNGQALRMAGRGDLSGDNYELFPSRAMGQDAIFASLDGVLTLVAEENVTAIPDGGGAVFTKFRLNNSANSTMSNENVVFDAEWGLPYEGVYARIDGVLRKIMAVGDPSPDGGTFIQNAYIYQHPVIDGGTIAFMATADDGVPSVFAWRDDELARVPAAGALVPGTSEQFTKIIDPSVSGDAVAFVGESANHRGVYLTDIGSPSQITKIADAGDPVPESQFVFTAVGVPAVGVNGGIVIFRGWFGTSRQGIFAYYEGQVHSIIETQRTFDGRMVHGISLLPSSVDGNNFAFTVSFEDTWLATYIASPPCDSLADITGEGALNTNDFFAFLALYQAQDPAADFDPGNGINSNDFFAFLALYQQGC